MEFKTCSFLSDSEKLEILELWNNEYPEKLAYKSKDEFDQYLKNLAEQSHILLIDTDKKIKGWYVDFNRDNKKWFALILNSNIQGRGFGTKILGLAKQKENELYGWVIDHNRYKKKNGTFYNSPLNFYLKNGFEKITEDRFELDKITAVKIRWKNRTTQN